MKSVESLVNCDQIDVEEFWKNRLSEMKVQVKEMEDSDGYSDPTMTSLVELMELAVSLKQYSRPTRQFNPVSKILKIRINTPRSVIEKIFGLKTVGVYGVGLYAVVDGLLLSRSFRTSSNFDSIGKKGVKYDLSSIPEDIKESYEFGLSIPAFDGIFVPKKSVLTSWITRSSQLQFFDISM